MRLTCRWLAVLAFFWGMLASPIVLGESGDGTGSENPKVDNPRDSEPTRYIISTGQSDEALAAMRPDQATWLRTESHGRVLALLEREHRSPAKGAVIIVGDVGQTADTGLTGALREPLAEAGWAAMSLGLPQPPGKLLQERKSAMRDSSGMSRGNGMENKSGNASETSAVIDVAETDNVAQMRTAYESELMDHLAAAGQNLRGSGYSPLIFVGIGRGADAVVAWSLSRGDGDSMIWVVPKLSVDHLDALAKGGASAGRAILDLVSAQVFDSNAADRRSRLRRDNLANYEQQALAISGRPQAVDADEIAHRITGWASRQMQNNGRPL